MIRLRELEAQLFKTIAVSTTEKDADGKYVFRDSDGEIFMWSPRPVRYEFHCVATVAEADSVTFLCPACFEKNGGPVGTHGIHVTFGRDVPKEADPNPRWNASGTTIDDLVLTPSILLNAGMPADQVCHWHGFVGSSGIQPGYAG